MSVLDEVALVPVEVGPCRCAGSPHDQDVVYLHPEATADLGMAFEAAVFGFNDGQAAQASVAVGRAFISYGVADWTFVDDAGNAIAVTPANVLRALPWDKGGKTVYDKAAELYYGATMRPLVERARTYSQRTSTVASISASGRSAQTRQKRSA